YLAHRDDEVLELCDEIVAIEEEWCPLLKWDVAMARKDYVTARAALEKTAAARGAQASALFHAQMDAIDGKGNIDAVARTMLEATDGQNDPAGITPMAGPDVMLWFIAIGRNDLAIERFARFARLLPHNARYMGFDSHLDVLHCEPRFVEIL